MKICYPIIKLPFLIQRRPKLQTFCHSSPILDFPILVSLLVYWQNFHQSTYLTLSLRNPFTVSIPHIIRYDDNPSSSFEQRLLCPSGNAAFTTNRVLYKTIASYFLYLVMPNFIVIKCPDLTRSDITANCVQKWENYYPSQKSTRN